MLILSLCIILVALPLLIVGLRGRVAARGRFCRSCDFDLQGIELAPEGSPCPECGRPVGPEHTIRPIRRAKRKGIVVVSLVLLLIGAGLITLHASGKSSSVFAIMPDRFVLVASEHGFDDAIDELIARLGANAAMPDWIWDGAIEAGLAHQRDTSQTWKPRWGEVLSLAIQNNRLSDQQLAEFVHNASVVNVWLRNRIRTGDSYVSYWCEEKPMRLSGLNRADTGYMLHVSGGASGVVYAGEEHRDEPNGGGMLGTSFVIPAGGPSGSSATGSGVMIPRDVRGRLKAGDEFELWMDIQLTLKSRFSDREIEAEPIRFTQHVTVVGEDEPIVAVTENPQAAKQIREGMSIEPIVRRSQQGMNGSAKQEFAHTTIMFTAKPESISGTLYLRRHSDGELFEAASISSQAQPVDITQTPIPRIRHSHQITIQIDPSDRERVEAFERVMSDGVVDVVFRTDPAVAETNAKISEVVDLELVFVGVPVLEEGDERLKSVPASDEIKTPASKYVED